MDRHEHELRVRANHRLLESFVALWDEHPEQRFGQLVMNLSRESGGFADVWEWKHGQWLDRIISKSMEWRPSSAGETPDG